MTTRVLVADDHELVRSGLALLLRRESSIAEVFEAGDGVAAVRAAADHRPAVVLMDIKMPRLDGIAACAQIVRHNPETKVLILTTYGLDAMVYRALHAGASGFLLKDAPVSRIVDAIDVGRHGDALLDPKITRRLIEHFVDRRGTGAVNPFHVLTEREIDVLAAVGRGLTNTEIAAHLTISISTVRTHLGRVLDKLGTRDRVQAVIAAYESGIVLPGG